MSEVAGKMEKSIESVKNHLASVRTGRANPELLRHIQVEYYGSVVPLKQMATISVPEPMCFALSVFDKSAVKAVEKAIQTSDLGIQPQVDGSVIRIRMPELTEERRKEYVKLIHKYAEEGKIAIRNIRRDYLDLVKKMEKDKEITEDDLQTEHEMVQKDTDKYINIIDELVKEKEKEIMQV